MRLYKKQPDKIIRIDIKGGAGNSTTITLDQTTLKEVYSFIENLFKGKRLTQVTPSSKPLKLVITIYSQIGLIRDKETKSLTIYNLSCISAKAIILNEINK